MLRQSKQTKKVSKKTPKQSLQRSTPIAKSSSKRFSTFKKVGAVPTPSQPPPEQPKTQKPKNVTPPPQALKPTTKAAVFPKQGATAAAAATSQPETTVETPIVEPVSTPPPPQQQQHEQAVAEQQPTPIAASTDSVTKQPTAIKTTKVDAVEAPLSVAMGGEPKTAILMLNMGGPKEPQETKSFLTNLFSDPMIINLGKFQWLGIRAAASRTQKVQKQYEKIGGSPIAKWTDLQGQSLTDVLDITSPSTAPHKHYIGFRYANPMTHSALEQIKKDGVKRVIAFSQFPMYSCTTTGSSLNDLWTQAKEMGLDLDFSVIDRWHDSGDFHEAIAQNIKAQILALPREELQETAILFSAHSVPLKTMNQGDQYPAEVSHTVEQTMVKLSSLMKQDSVANGTDQTPALPHMLCWQSKVGFLPWLQPSTTTAIEKVKTLGFKQAIIVPVAFTSDHIETLHEIDIEYKELAEKHGIKLIRAESLNNSMFLTKAQANIVKKHIDNNEIVSSHQYRIRCNECLQPEICRSVLGYGEKELFENKRLPKQ